MSPLLAWPPGSQSLPFPGGISPHQVSVYPPSLLGENVSETLQFPHFHEDMPKESMAQEN